MRATHRPMTFLHQLLSFGGLLLFEEEAEGRGSGGEGRRQELERVKAGEPVHCIREEYVFIKKKLNRIKRAGW